MDVDPEDAKEEKKSDDSTPKEKDDTKPANPQKSL